MGGVPGGETGDLFRGNLWGDFGRGGRRPGFPGAAIRARGAGPGHSTGRTGALRTGAACGSTGEVRRAQYRTNRVAAVCERCGIAGTGEKRSRWKRGGAEGHQAATKKTATGPPPATV